jgi:hypothetical protein
MSMRNWLIAGCIALAGGCANYGADLVPGQSSATDVETLMGQPTAVKEVGNGETILWYSKLPMGRESYAARIDPRGTLLSFEQRLTDQNIALLQRNVSTVDDLMNILGPPYRRFKFPFKDREAWEYPVRTGPELQTLFVEVSPDFVVREVYKLYDRDRSNGLSFGGFSFGF